MALLAIAVGVANTLMGNAHDLGTPAVRPGARDAGGQALPAAARLRRRIGGPDRRRGDRQRRARVQAAGVQERGQHARGDGPPPRRHLHRPDLRRACSTTSGQPTSRAPTVLGQIGGAVFGGGSIPFFVLQVSAALILFLAANTSFNAFPRLAAILAQDGYIPRQFAFRGDRLAFSWGIVVLAAVAVVMLVIFDADTHALIPLYSVGVFICFTLSQTGMVLHWRREQRSGLGLARPRQRLRRGPDGRRLRRRGLR